MRALLRTLCKTQAKMESCMNACDVFRSYNYFKVLRVLR